MSCGTNAIRVGRAAKASGVADGQNAYQAGQNEAIRIDRSAGSLEQRTLPWPLPSRKGGWWREYSPTIKAALKAWRAKKDDRTLLRLRTELAAELAERARQTEPEGHPAGQAGALAEERTELLISPPKSIPVGERVERIAILDNALALLRLKRAITAAQYRAALVEIVCRRQAALPPSTAPVTWLPDRPVGGEIKTASAVDPSRTIRVRFRAIELAEPVTSHDLSGRPEPGYDQALQPRQRDRAVSQVQIEGIARQLEPRELLKLKASWADGPPLVGPHGLVESGNGRLLAIRRAIDINPAGYQAYRRQLIERALEFGLERTQVEALKTPVLVRERLTELTEPERLRFVAEANASQVARMGVAEQAQADAALLSPGFLADLQVSGSDRSLAEVLSKQANSPVIARFVKRLPETEQAALMDRNGRLSTEGIDRLERALFAYALPGPSGERLTRLVYEEGEAIDRVGAGLKQALPKLGQLEDLVRAGQRDKAFSLGPDLAVVVETMRDLRRRDLKVTDYVRQSKMFEELTPLQEQWLVQLDQRRRSGRAVAKLIKAYAQVAMETNPPSQRSMFGNSFKAEPANLLRAALKQVGGHWIELRQDMLARREQRSVAMS
jgi:hypothetical protein